MTTIGGNDITYTGDNIFDNWKTFIIRQPTQNSNDIFDTASNIIPPLFGSVDDSWTYFSFYITIYNNSAFNINISGNTGITMTSCTITPETTKSFSVTKTSLTTLIINCMTNSPNDGYSGIQMGSGKIMVGNSDGVATELTISGDATIDNTAVITLANTAVTPGTYGTSTQVSSLTVDSKGRITDVNNITITPNLVYTRTVVNSATYTLLSTDFIIAVTYTTTGTVTLTLPQISSVGIIRYIIKDEGKNSEQYNITINTTGGDTIEGETSGTIDVNGAAWAIYNDNSTSWFIE